MDTVVYVIRYGVSLIFGVVISAAFSGVLQKKNALSLSVLTVTLGIIQGIFAYTLGFDLTFVFYPLHTHLVLILALIFLYKRTVIQAVLSTLLAYMCCQTPSWFSRFADYFGDRNGITELVIYVVIVTALLLFIVRFVAEPVMEFVAGSKTGAIIFTFIPAVYYIFDYATSVWSDFLYGGNFHAVQFMPMIICAAYLGFIALFSIEQKRRMEAIEQRDLIEGQLRTAEAEFETLRQMQQAARIYRHDMRHHFSLLMAMAESDNVEGIKSYLRENIKNISSFTPRRYCEIETMNLLLSHFAERAEQNGISFSCEVRLPDRLPLENTELCALVSNAIENALTAVDELGKGGSIEVRMVFMDGKLIFSVDNPCGDDVTIVNGIPATSEEGHGFGTRSIAAIAKAHHGDAVFRVKDNVFSLMVIIPEEIKDENSSM